MTFAYSISLNYNIDIIAKTEDENGTIVTLACDCKFGRGSIDFAPLNILVERCESTSIRENVRYALFSIGGFQEELREHAKENGILLVDYETLMGIKLVP